MTSRASALSFEAYLRRNGRLTHDEELDLMTQGISLQDHYGLLPDQYILPPRDFLPCRWIEQYDLTVHYGAHSLGSAEHALRTQWPTAGALLPNAAPTGGHHRLGSRPRADSVVAGEALGAQPRVEYRLAPALINVKRNLEADPDFQDEIPLQRQKRAIDLDENFEDEIPLKRRKQGPAPQPPKIKLKSTAFPPPARPPAASAAPSNPTPRNRTITGPQLDEEFHPPPRSTHPAPLPNIYTHSALPYTTSTPQAATPAPAPTPTRTPSITSSGRSISPPPPRPPPPSATFQNGTRKIPVEIREMVTAVGQVKKGKDGLPQRMGLRNTVGFRGRDGVMKATSALWQWYGDTRLFSEREWRYFGSNEEGKRRRAAAGRGGGA